MNKENQEPQSPTERKNPFFEPYRTPHDTVPFDRIRMEDYEEAFMEGIRRDEEYLDKTINNPDKPTFDNTIINKEDNEGYYDLLERVSTVFFNMLSADTNDEMDALAQKLSPILTKHANDMRLNEKLFERVKYVHLHHRKLTHEEKRLLDDCYQGFVRSGALLDAEGKERLRQLTEEASLLGLQFSQNLLKENKAYRLVITDPAQLDGLPQTAIDAAAEEAKVPLTAPEAPLSSPEGDTNVLKSNEAPSGAVGGALGTSWPSWAWQWNHNPVDSAWSLSARSGWMTFSVLPAATMKDSRNMLTQKTVGYESEATVRIDATQLKDGDRAGLLCMGKQFMGVGICQKDGRRFFYLEENGEQRLLDACQKKTAFLRVSIDSQGNSHQFSVSLDGKTFRNVGSPFALRMGYWKGSRIGLYSYATGKAAGKVAFSDFRYDVTR